MRRSIFTALVALALITTAAHAQWGAGVGPVAAIPIGDTGDALKTGILVNVGVGASIKAVKGLGIGGEVYYGSADFKAPLTGSNKMTMLFGTLSYNLMPDSHVSPYIGVGGGTMKNDPDNGSSKSDGMFIVTGGVGGPIRGRLGFWGEGRYLQAGSGDSKTQLFLLGAGISFNFGAMM
jgi:hypothetical protein